MKSCCDNTIIIYSFWKSCTLVRRLLGLHFFCLLANKIHSTQHPGRSNCFVQSLVVSCCGVFTSVKQYMLCSILKSLEFLPIYSNKWVGWIRIVQEFAWLSGSGCLCAVEPAGTQDVTVEKCASKMIAFTAKLFWWPSNTIESPVFSWFAQFFIFSLSSIVKAHTKKKNIKRIKHSNSSTLSDYL